MFALTYIFLAFTLLFAALYVGASALGKGKSFFKKGKKLSEIEEQHDRLRDQLRDLKHHYYWAQSNGEKQKEKSMEKQIFEVEDKIEELEEEYRIFKAGGHIPFKEVPKKE